MAFLHFLRLLPFVFSARNFSNERDVLPLPPVWPSTFQVDFDEETYFGFWTVRTAGTFYYDSQRNMSRVDRSNGVGDRFCGSAKPFTNTPCTQLVRDSMRYLIFPEFKYCCKCCSNPDGCSTVAPSWLANATYEGRDSIYGIRCNKWNLGGIPASHYWQALDYTPVRLMTEFAEQMTFRYGSYRHDITFDDDVFEYPTDMDCSLSCYGACAVINSEERAPPRRGRERAKRVLPQQI